MTNDEGALYYIEKGTWDVDVETGIIRGRSGQPLGTVTDDGYVQLSWEKDGYRSTVRAHRVVWLAKHGSIPDDRVVDHINRDRQDNRIENLRLATHSVNTDNRDKTTYKRGGENHRAKLTDAQVARMRELRADGVSAAEIARAFGVSHGHASRVTRGTRR